MTGRTADHSRIVPRLEPGLTVLERPKRGSTALHRLALAELDERDGRAFWLDARNEASTYALYDLASNRTRLDRVQVARAFTAYQHHSLVRTVAREATDPALVVVPRLPSLYRDDDVPDREARDLFESSLIILREFGETFDVPVLTTAETDPPVDLLDEYADVEIECTRTDAGLRYATEEFETTVYLDDGGWQTTIPYWVELFGAVVDDPVVAAQAAGLVDGVEV